ncbi:MAG: pyridoxal phosphate-dependent aminotransferase [Alphaproteobacteria bacterium]
MAAALDIAPAITRLENESAFAVLARAQALARQGKEVINLGIGQPDFKTPEHIVDAAVKALRDGQHGYTATEGILPLREAVAADIRQRRGVEVDPGHILVVPGGKVTMFFAILMFGRPGVEIITPNPGFPIYESMIHYTGAEAVPMRLREENGFAFSAEEVLRQINDRTRLLIINSPANPTSGVTPKAEMDRLVEGLAAWPKVAVLSDEIYSRLLYDGRQHVSLLGYESLRDRLIVLDGWSKTYAMTGWRLGYGVWPASLMEHAVNLAVNSHSCVNAATQFAGIAALNGPQESVDIMLRAFDQRRRVLTAGLNQLPGVTCQESAGAFYCFPNITGTGMTSNQLQTRLLEEAGIATIAGTSFGADGEGYIRFSYANSVEAIETALARMGDLLR